MTGLPTFEEDAAGELTIDNTLGLRVSLSAPVVLASGTTVVLAPGASVALAANVPLTDAMANPSPQQVGSFLLGFNGTTWDRLRAISPASASLTTAGNVLETASTMWALDTAGSAVFRRIRCESGSLLLTTTGKPSISTNEVIGGITTPNVTAALVSGGGGNHQVFSFEANNSLATTGLWCGLVNKNGTPVNGDGFVGGTVMWVPLLQRQTKGPTSWGWQGINLSVGTAFAWSTTPEAVTLPGAGTGLSVDIRFV